MKRWTLTLVLAMVLVWAVRALTWAAPVPKKVSGNDLWAGGAARGMVLGLYSDGNGRKYEQDLDELVALGVNSVSIHVPWVIDHVGASKLHAEPWITPSDRRLRQCIRAAHERGLDVLLFPLLFVEQVSPGKWRGTLEPKEPVAWDQAYGQFILHYAALAEEEEVAWLSIGNELLSMEIRELFWRGLIRKVRHAYKGKVIYGLNWDQLDQVRFHDALDAVAVNGYFELVSKNSPNKATQEQINKSWRKVRKDLETLFPGKPLMFTEVGYRPVAESLNRPWDHGEDRAELGGLDLNAQAMAYQGFFQAFADSHQLAGAYMYMWWGEGGRQDDDYTPRGKPAADVLAHFWRATTPSK